jgi:hypothetical protein
MKSDRVIGLVLPAEGKGFNGDMVEANSDQLRREH